MTTLATTWLTLKQFTFGGGGHAVAFLAAGASLVITTFGVWTLRDVAPQAHSHGDSIVIAIPAAIDGWDPHAHTHSPSQAIYANVFDLLLELGPAGELEAVLARSWLQVNDTTWQIDVRRNVRWHDGSEFSAHDVVFTLDRLRRDDSLGQHQFFRGIASVEATDATTVVVRTYEPDPILPLRLAKPGAYMLPAAYIASVGWARFLERPVGTGAYRFERVESIETVVLTGFPDHWRGRPAYDLARVRVVADAHTRLLEVQSGSVHIATGLAPHAGIVLREHEGVTTFVVPTRRVLTLVLNTDESTLTGDPLVRWAIDLAIDRISLIDVALAGVGTSTRARLSPDIYMAPQEYLVGGRHDPELAAELVRSSRYDESVDVLTIQLPSDLPNASDVASLMAHMLADVGLVVRIELMEPGAFMHQVWQGAQVRHVAVRSLGNSLGDAQYALRDLTCDGQYQPMTRWCRSDFDDTYRRALVEEDSDGRCSLIRDLYTIVSEDRPTISLVRLDEIVAVNDAVAWQPRGDQSLRVFEAVPRIGAPSGDRVQWIQPVMVSAGVEHEEACAAAGHDE